MPEKIYRVDVCIVGAGPAGMILGLLLAHQGIKVLVLESHHDFEREYRGEVLMPRFIQMMRQTGLLSHLEKYPHLKLKNFEFHYKDKVLANVDFAGLCPQAPFALWMSQTVMLNALREKAVTYPNFQLLFGVTARDVVREGGKIVGVMGTRRAQQIEVRARVTVGADGRASAMRKTAEFKMEYEDYDFDVVWFTVKRREQFENTVRAFFTPRRTYLILPKHPDLVQCGILVGKGEFSQIREQGIGAMRQELLSAHPVLHDFARQLTDFEPFSVLQARVSYVARWAKEGCLLIGDAAHTCSPAGAIGVSVAAATAIVAADVIIKGFKRGDLSLATLNKVQMLRGSDVQRIQTTQAAFTRAALLRYPRLRPLALLIIFTLARAGIMPKFFRRIVVMDGPLPVDPAISLENPAVV
ncbi:MAG TPA: hypothetical protein DE315_07960 [Candidatus Omnitrophica bacterium]|nr:hypothetical protein [Candidatus Omnitrophota bacterium]HCI45446.1 hypothetical protein [Candidatus Omnitrophota bacterium]